MAAEAALDDPGLSLRLTAFSRRCAELWLARRGRRWVYKTSKARGARNKERARGAGTDANMRRGQKRALGALFARAAAEPNSSRQTVLGVSRSKVMRGARNIDIDPKPLEAFRAHTATKYATQRAAQRLRGIGGRPFVRPKLRRAWLFGEPGAAQGAAARPAPPGPPARDARCLNATGGSIDARPGCSRTAAPDEDTSLLRAVLRSDAVIVRSVWGHYQLHRTARLDYMAGLRCSWKGLGGCSRVQQQTP